MILSFPQCRHEGQIPVLRGDIPPEQHGSNKEIEAISKHHQIIEIRSICVEFLPAI
jgi:hypothetical protein